MRMNRVFLFYSSITSGCSREAMTTSLSLYTVYFPMFLPASAIRIPLRCVLGLVLGQEPSTVSIVWDDACLSR